jgi:hypothetical protein
MSRLVRDDPESGDGFAARVVKYVPSEILAFYISVENIIKELKPPASDGAAATGNFIDVFIVNKGPYWLFFLCWLGIPFYLVLQKDKNVNKCFVQSVISMVLFPVWVYSMDGLIFDRTHTYSAALSAILLAFVTLMSGIVPNSFSWSDINFRSLFGFGKKAGVGEGGPAAVPAPSPPATAASTPAEAAHQHNAEVEASARA